MESSAIVLDEYTIFSIREVCHVCGVNAELVIELVDEGVLHPAKGSQPDNWRFTGDSLVRAQKALNLQRDLRVNLAGAALALDLLDEIENLRRQMRLGVR